MPDGSTRKHSYETKKRLGQPTPELDNAPALPQCLEYIWEWYLELSAERPEGLLGPGRLTLDVIRVWREEKGLPPLLPYELEGIREIDKIFRKSQEPSPEAVQSAESQKKPVN